MINAKRMIRLMTAVLLMLSAPAPMLSQVYHPEEGFVYSDEEIPKISITISQGALDSLYADPYANEEYRVLFAFTRGGVTETLSDVGLRFRGNFSRDKVKKSFRVSFNTFDTGRDFHGIEKMNLNAETNDPSLVRSKLAWHLFRYLGIAGSRTNHVLLYINGDFNGVYINTEHIDEKFVRSRFGSNDGNLYKCLWPADLTYKGDQGEDYKFGQERRAYELRINEEWDDYEDLAKLIKVLNDYSGTEFREELEKVMNVQQYLKIMAVDVMSGNWDGHIGNQNNFYLYRDQVTGRFEYIPYDLDNTFGIDWLQEDWSNRSIYNWHRDERPLYEKILLQESYKKQYSGYIRELAAYMTSGAMQEEVERWHNQISGWVAQDSNYAIDFGYVYEDFQNALTSGNTRYGHLPYGVLEYCGIRAATSTNEAISADAPPLISHARLDASPGFVRVDWSVEDDQEGFSTSLHYRIDGESWQNRAHQGPSMTDQVSGVTSFLDSIEGLTDNAVVDVYFTATDNGAQETRYPAGFLSVEFPLANGPLLINEFMASNNTAVGDEYGEFDDWVEIYNPTSSGIWLGEVYLSDDAGVPGRYRFPDEYIGPFQQYLVWLDGQPEQGANHASFKLRRSGEQIRLSGRPSEGYYIMDSLTYGEQVTDVAMGRTEDGGPEWMAFFTSTPGESNMSSPVDEYLAEGHLALYPNPVTGGTLFFNRLTEGTIFTLTGRVAMFVSESMQVDVRSMQPGVYIFRPAGGIPVRFIVL